MSDRLEYRFTVLGEDNYITWKWQISMILESRGLMPCVSGTSSDASKNHLAATFLASTLSEQNMQRVINCTTAAQIWTTLETMFENKSSTERAMLMQKLMSFKIDSVRDISGSIGELQALAAKLRSLKMNIDEDLVVSILLKALPESLKTWTSTWMMVNAKDPKLNQLISAVMAEISSMRQPEDVALVAAGRARNDKQAQDQEDAGPHPCPHCGSDYKKHGPNTEKNVCHYCGKPGHYIRECKKRMADEGLMSKPYNVAM